MKKKLTLAAIVIVLCAIMVAVIENFQSKSNTAFENVKSNKAVSQEIQKDTKGSTKPSTDTKAVGNDNQKENTGEVKTTGNSSSTSVSSSSNKVNSNESKPAAQTPKTETVDKSNKSLPPNFVVTDTVSNKTILSVHVDYKGESAADATINTLNANNISYKASGFGNSIYFSMIAGLKERGAGAASGWCYFINGNKVNTSAGNYKMNNGDKVEWKYLKDGTSN